LAFTRASPSSLDGISRVFWWYSIPNLFLGHVSTVSELLFLAAIYRISLKGFVRPWLISSCMVVFTAMAIVNSLFLQGFEFNNSNIKIIESGLVLTFVLLFFLKLAREMQVKRLERYTMFWVSCAVLIYFSSTLFIFIYSNYVLLYSQELGIYIWFIHAIFLILFHLALCVSLWIVPRNSNLPG
jgi:hypothetical protein